MNAWNCTLGISVSQTFLCHLHSSSTFWPPQPGFSGATAVPLFPGNTDVPLYLIDQNQNLICNNTLQCKMSPLDTIQFADIFFPFLKPQRRPQILTNVYGFIKADNCIQPKSTPYGWFGAQIFWLGLGW